MKKASKAAAFLENMSQELAPPAAPGKPEIGAPKQPKNSTRSGLKHIGGYFEPDTVEKVAVLRARLRLDNSELIKLAIDDLHRKHSAKRAFGDV